MMIRNLTFVVAVMTTVMAFAQTAAPAPRRSLLSGRTGLGQPAAAPAPAAPTTPSPAPAPASTSTNDAPVSAYDETGTNFVLALDFTQAPVDVVFKAYSEQIGKTIIPAPDIPKPAISLHSESGKLTKEEYLQAIEVTLAMNGIVLQPFGKSFLKAIPRKTARQHGMSILPTSDKEHPEQTRVISQLFQLKYVTAADAQKALEGFKDPSGLFQVFERNNALLVTDIQENINRMFEIVKMIDVPNPVREEVFVRKIQFALAADIKKALETIVTESQKETQKESTGTKQSGAPGFGGSRTTTTTTGNRLLGLNNRPGVNQPAATSTANEAMVASDADRGMIRGKVQILEDERSNQLIIITMKENMDFFDKVIKTLDVETSPEVKVEVIRLKYAEAKEVSEMINDLIGNSTKNNKNNTNSQGGGNRSLTSYNPWVRQQVQQPQQTTTSKVGELNKENVKVLADERINGLVVMARAVDMPTLHTIIEAMDVKLSQVLIETVIIEVGLGDDLATGIDWVHGMQQKANGYHQGLQGGGGDKVPGWGLTNATELVAKALPAALSPGTAGLSYAMFSERFDLGAVVEASKSDSHSKYIASPVVMTVDNKEATIEATEARKFFDGYETSSSYSTYVRTPKYDAKDIGITIKVTPKINPNGTVMLEVEEEYTQLGNGQTILVDNGTAVIDTSVKRKMTADVILENMQTVVLGGLTESRISEKTTGIPFLKDIPYVGKWLFGHVEQSEARKELLVFMTPYVIEDANAAQEEARRRKNAMSDARPWLNNGGWSKSQLADQNELKEQLRRLKEEWKKQDEERAAEIGIENAKGKREVELKEREVEEHKIRVKNEETNAKRMKKAEDELVRQRREEEARKASSPESIIGSLPEEQK